ncbi:hypothetical protein OV207_02690 [Corallococcus sp. BB11-1]|uniref:hypothetical protein n=1 Tax=Corallococcus sp. BB11-1 TaxID=2996783 RepID=UPI00226EED1D|nr:hypothetical protein [Corallococcus sp. BB11-1]MCY1030349.1 hypothetical protein [Corallococcus sp. BB11-1]
MSARSQVWCLKVWCLMGLLLGCAMPNPAVRVQELADGSLQVEGPLAGPFKGTEALAAAACELMTAQPGADATHGQRGKEYCALHYYSEQEQGYFLSFLSDIGGDGPDGRKYCLVPRKLDELGHRRVVLLGPAHSHPHNPLPSDRDMGALRPEGWSPLGTSRFFEQETGRIWDRELYI